MEHQPTLRQDVGIIERYTLFDNVTDSNITLEEVKNAMKKIGKGASLMVYIQIS